MNPFFSIIIVSLNAEKFIESTINSIKKQTFENYEVIVKDGCSKDKTLLYVPTNDSRFHIYQMPDKSLYDAMNQAIGKTTGNYVVFMNCGDVFADSDVLFKISEAIRNDQYMMFYGDYSREGILHRQPDKLTSFYMYRTPLCHQTIFFNGDELRTGEIYNTEYKILADYDLELRLMKKGKVGHAPITVCIYQGGGVSESRLGIKKKTAERKNILIHTFSRSQRFIYGLKFHATMPKIRTFIMYSNKSPKWMKKLYQMLVNEVNR